MGLSAALTVRTIRMVALRIPLLSTAEHMKASPVVPCHEQ
jgi:hypothetical protein